VDLNYVDGDPANSSEDTKAEAPLAAAEVESRKSKAPGLLPVEVLPEAALPARRPDGVFALVSKLPSEKTA
jgi:type VI secretion system protein ImpC